MKTQSKILFAAALALVIALPLMSVAMTYSYEGETDDSGSPHRERARQLLMQRVGQHWGPWFSSWFFKEAEIVTVEGTVTAHARHVLVLTTDEDERLNIVLPGSWNVDSEVFGLPQIFEEGYISIGDEVSIKALQRTVTNENEVTITAFLGYEIVDETNGNHLYAVLPFNIEE